MIAFGGSGPIHALRVARKLRIPSVVFPVGAGVMSAIGLLVSPLSFDTVRSHRVLLDELDARTFAQHLEPLLDEAAGRLEAAGIARNAMRVERRLDMRYEGQGFEIEVPVPDDEPGVLSRLAARFEARYGELFTVTSNTQPIEIVNWKIAASGPAPRMADAYRPAPEHGARVAGKGSRPAYFPEARGYIDCPVFDRYALKAGQQPRRSGADRGA